MTLDSSDFRTWLLGVPADCLRQEQALAFAELLLCSEERQGHLILAMNPEKVLTLRQDPELRACFDQAALLLPDGVGVSLVLRLFHGRTCGRVTGVDMLDSLCRLAERHGQRVFVLGGREEVNREACRLLQLRFPCLQLAGRAHGYLSPSQWEDLPGRIRESGADLVAVALGSPRQERWMRDARARLNVKILQGVGGSLDVLAGRVKRAPLWMRRLGLEWLWRLMREPSRVRRQIRLPLFLFLALWERVTKGRCSFANEEANSKRSSC